MLRGCSSVSAVVNVGAGGEGCTASDSRAVGAVGWDGDGRCIGIAEQKLHHVVRSGETDPVAETRIRRTVAALTDGFPAVDRSSRTR
ncbi:hypothetical protein GCM10012279_16650 [Micromonospora yangpuensis]|nr:hypothetical protein GCM10012279_16650 [Micromonospora yangpuensis]